MNFSANINANSGKTVTREVPFDGYHTELLYGANAATQNKVGVKMINGATGEQVFPGDRDTEYVNLADIMHPFQLVFQVGEDDILEVVYENLDDAPHYLNVVSTVVQPADDGGGR